MRACAMGFYAAREMDGGYPATLISTGVGRPLGAGRVHSVFRRAVNFEFGADLVSLAGPATGGLPNGIVLEAEVDFLGLVAPGWVVRRTPERLWVERSRLAVDLRAAHAWSPRLERCCLLRSLQEVRDALAKALERVPVQGGLAPLLWGVARGERPRAGLARTCAAAYPALVGLAQARDLETMLASARDLIGLGEGLTPSGDDFLVGFSAALRARGSPLEPGFTSGCAELAKGRTTRIAQSFLAHAARGEYSARMHRLVRALSGEGELANELTVALEWGASSGADTLLGVLVGVGE